jgi:hypothetical protein
MEAKNEPTGEPTKPKVYCNNNQFFVWDPEGK